jgi:hypothetical protein
MTYSIKLLFSPPRSNILVNAIAQIQHVHPEQIQYQPLVKLREKGVTQSVLEEPNAEHTDKCSHHQRAPVRVH